MKSAVEFRLDPLVNVASHTPRLTAASATFRKDLDAVHVATGRAEVCASSAVSTAPVLQVRAGLDKLAAQISRTVLWADCLSGCVEAGASAFLECSPGRALTNIHG